MTFSSALPRRPRPGCSIYVTENGCAAEDYATPEGVVNDFERIDYLHGHLAAAWRAIQEGVPLAGYFYWSFSTTSSGRGATRSVSGSSSSTSRPNAGFRNEAPDSRPDRTRQRPTRCGKARTPCRRRSCRGASWSTYERARTPPVVWRAAPARAARHGLQIFRFPVLLHRVVECEARRSELGLPDESQGLGSATVPIHAAVFPLDRQRTGVTDLVQRPEQLVEIDVTASGRDEVPAAGTVAEGEVRGEDRAAAVETTLRVLHVHVVDAGSELARVESRVQELGNEVARVEVDSEGLAVPERLERLSRRHEVIGDLGRMHLQTEADAFALENLEYRLQTLRDLLIAALDLLEVVGRERVEQSARSGSRQSRSPADTPKTAAARAVSSSRRAARRRTPSGSPSPQTSGGRMRRWRSSIKSQMAWPTRCAPSAKHPRPWRSSSSRRALRVVRVGEGGSHVEVVAPAGKLEPVVAPGCRPCCELRKRKVRPLPGEESQRPSHDRNTRRSMGFAC